MTTDQRSKTQTRDSYDQIEHNCRCVLLYIVHLWSDESNNDTSGPVHGQGDELDEGSSEEARTPWSPLHHREITHSFPESHHTEPDPKELSDMIVDDSDLHTTGRAGAGYHTCNDSPDWAGEVSGSFFTPSSIEQAFQRRKL